MPRYPRLEFECASDDDPEFQSDVRKHEELKRRLEGIPGVLVYRRKFPTTDAHNHHFTIYSIWAILLDPSQEPLVQRMAEQVGIHEDEDAFEWVDDMIYEIRIEVPEGAPAHSWRWMAATPKLPSDPDFGVMFINPKWWKRAWPNERRELVDRIGGVISHETLHPVFGNLRLRRANDMIDTGWWFGTDLAHDESGMHPSYIRWLETMDDL